MIDAVGYKSEGNHTHGHICGCDKDYAGNMMCTEIQANHTTGEKAAEAEIEINAVSTLAAVEQTALSVLEKYDGLCLDVPAERCTLANALATALTDALHVHTYLANYESPKRYSETLT